jgi:hypothetical protein
VRPTLSVLILSFNRKDALRRTLRELHEAGVPGWRDDTFSEVIIADNASTDGTREMLSSEFPHVRTLLLERNIAIGGFNRAAEAAQGSLLLILDDDAWPAPGVLQRAVALMLERPALGGIALLPVHPATQKREWSFARRARTFWPVMGCANLVRAEAWRRVGGYEETFFLYRNDVDLAMMLLSSGYDVLFDPALVAYHDSPAAASKSTRWLELATRNWMWLCKRHGGAMSRIAGCALGGAWALVHAGFSMSRVRSVGRGTWRGVTQRAPQLPAGCVRGGGPLRKLLRVTVLERWRTPRPQSAPVRRA